MAQTPLSLTSVYLMFILQLTTISLRKITFGQLTEEGETYTWLTDGPHNMYKLSGKGLFPYYTPLHRCPWKIVNKLNHVKGQSCEQNTQSDILYRVEILSNVWMYVKCFVVDNDWEEIRMGDCELECLEKSDLDGLIGEDKKHKDLFVSRQGPPV